MKVTPYSSHRRWNYQTDPRDLTQGQPIPSEGYADQPYMVKAADGSWVCVVTTGSGNEGEDGQHVVSARSRDQGKTWSDIAELEPVSGPPASWALPVVVPGGRIYTFYVLNDSGVTEVPLDPEYQKTVTPEVVAKVCRRVDTVGSLVFRYSEDHGCTWSEERYPVPIREFAIDRANDFAGKVRYFWGVGKPIVHDNRVYLGLSKVGRFGHEFLQETEGFFMRSDNLCTERNPARIVWETLPEGDVGLKSVAGPIAEEHNLVALSDGSLFCTYRTIEGFACHAYSRDEGRTWTPPAPMTDRPGGRIMKNPRAANFVKRLEDGTFIYWYHFNGVPHYNNIPWEGNRNIAWMARGKEHAGADGRVIHWSQPEIVSYDPNFLLGCSYPDFIEDGGDLYISGTQKTFGFTSKVDRELMAGLKEQDTICAVPTEGLCGAWRSGEGACSLMPIAPRLCEGGGLSLEFSLTWNEPKQEIELFANTDATDRGFSVQARPGGRLRVLLQDEAEGCFWDSDSGLLKPGQEHHIVIMVDGGSKVVAYLIDGILADGGAERYYGWGRISPNLKDVSAGPLVVASETLHHVRCYGRYLRTSEAVGLWRFETSSADSSDL